MGYGFQPADSIPLSYNSYQAVFPTPNGVLGYVNRGDAGSTTGVWFSDFRCLIPIRPGSPEAEVGGAPAPAVIAMDAVRRRRVPGLA
jgi:hypothetical protein